MQIVAKVVNQAISEKDLHREQACGGSASQALRRLIDRCLLLEKAQQEGISASDEEFDIALMEILDEERPFGLPPGSLQDMDALEMETLIRNNIIIRKYVAQLCPKGISLPERHLQEIYQEQIENFCHEEMVRCSHILITGENALQEITRIRKRINDSKDFERECKIRSECPSNECCGDLGFFPRGKLFPLIDEVAFALELNEISQPFKSPQGYHILMLTERRDKSAIPFAQIKDSLSDHLLLMEREYILMRHLDELHEEFQSQILIYDDALK